MKKMFLALLFTATICFGQATTSYDLSVLGKVVKVKDGDTIVVLQTLNVDLPSGVNSVQKMVTIRVAGVDTPEKNQDYGQVAKQFASNEVFGKVVTFKEVSKDMYGRSVAFVFYDNDKNLSEELLKNGLAWHYSRYDKTKYLQDLEDTARKDKVGLWSLPNPIMPSEFRKGKKTMLA
jgi:endonuclease YncB( thermonuclease family)